MIGTVPHGGTGPLFPSEPESGNLPETIYIGRVLVDTCRAKKNS